MGLNDPLADLKAELAAEAAAAEGTENADKPAPKAKDSVAPDEDEESEEAPAEDGEEEAPEAKADDKPKAKADVKTKFVPVSRVNEETAKRRKAERAVDDLTARLAALEASANDGKPAKPVSEDDRKRVVAEARQLARLEVMAEGFVNAGYEEYGQKEFDSISSALSDLGAPENLVVIAVEATGSPTGAARAIFNLGQQEAEIIEAIFKMSPIRIGAKLAALATARRPKAPVEDAEEGDEDEKPKAKANGKAPSQVSKAPAPIKPVGGKGAAANDDDISDDLTEDQFTDRFNKLMDRKFARSNR